MEFCVDLLTENSEALREFSLPQEYDTVWGKAVRAEEEGRLYWSEGVFVRRGSPDRLLRLLPEDRHEIGYEHFIVGGTLFNEIPIRGDSVDGENSRSTESDLCKMVRALCSNSPSWAILFFANCDDLEWHYSADMDAAVAIIDLFVRGDLDRSDYGFCIISS